MKILLDTHIMLWALFNMDKLPNEDIVILNNINNDIYVSTASIWEVVIKNQKRPESMPVSYDELVSAIKYARYNILPILPEHLSHIPEIINQNIHNDPFDHVILATAKEEKMVLLTHDDNISKYSDVDIKKVS